jgi:hypothetical protein
MKNGILVSVSVFLLLSLTFKQAEKSTNYGKTVAYTLPIKPKKTVIVLGEESVYKFLKKGYQIQCAWHSTKRYENYYVLVKYSLK